MKTLQFFALTFAFTVSFSSCKKYTCTCYSKSAGIYAPNSQKSDHKIYAEPKDADNKCYSLCRDLYGQDYFTHFVY